jgi:hypothetical protein
MFTISYKFITVGLALLPITRDERLWKGSANHWMPLNISDEPAAKGRFIVKSVSVRS